MIQKSKNSIITVFSSASSMIHSPLEFNEIVDLDDYMFHLRDAVVLVSTKPPAPVENLGDCYAEDNEEDNNIAVVRILVEQEPILPDYEFLASKIQRYCHMWYLHRKVKINSDFILIYDLWFLLFVTSHRLLQR